mgnify:FL=1
MIRRALEQDVAAIGNTYTELLRHEEEHGSSSNWRLGVYPTETTAAEAVSQGTMFVLEEEGEICASMVLNQNQAAEYASIPWEYEAEPEEVLVLHTLCIPPSKAGRGYGKQMAAYAKKFALDMGCTVMRIDTFSGNEPAKGLYQKNGFRIAGYAQVLHEGVIEEELVYLECRL